jgi:predicted CXXCH cytochrome family protein
MTAIDRHPTALRGHAALLAACALAALLGCAGSGAPRAVPAGAGSRTAQAPAATPDAVRSNVARGDYAGSAACVPCHADVAAAWEGSPMHRMTRDARAAEIRAPFDGTTLKFKDDEVVLERRGADRFVRIEHGAREPADDRPGASASPGRSKTYRVTRVIGGRTREDFAGVEVGGPGEEVVLPISYLLASGTLRYKGYSVMVHERATVRAGPIWSRSCIFCHNTVPEMDRLLGAIVGPRAPGYQGEQVDRWLPLERRAHVRVTDDGLFASAAGAEIVRLGGVGSGDGDRAPSLARRTLDVVRSGFDGEALIEVGIGCEACHGGSREHARDPRRRPSFVAVAPWLEVASAPPSKPAPLSGGSAPASGGAEAQAINRTCARCHQVLFSRYPFTWEGGRRDGTAGGSHINSGEGRDFLLGGCAGAMACTRCHDPHGADDAGKLRALATPAGNATCTGCHSELADRQRLKDHAHHDPDGAGGSCVACHMPRKNMGLDGTLTRYHRIGSPTDAARVLGDRPLECALCHADRSAGSLVDAMERWWPVRYPRQRIAELYGSLDANVIRATLERGKPHEQAVAMATLGAGRDRSAVPLVARQLLGEYPLVREWAKRALTSILGRCDVDLAADDATIARQASSCGGLTPVAPATATDHATDEDPED